MSAPGPPDFVARLAPQNYSGAAMPWRLLLGRCWQRLGQVARMQSAIGPIAMDSLTRAATKVRLCLLKRALSRARKEPPDAELGALLECLPAGGALVHRETLLIEKARDLPPLEALALLDEVRGRCAAWGYDGHVRATHLYSAEAAMAVDPPLARRRALAAADRAQMRSYAYGYRAETWLICGKALRAAGDETQAARLLRRGGAWVRDLARRHVPGEFRDGFLHRNPVNAELLALSARLDLLDDEALAV